MTAGEFELGTDGPGRILVGVDGSETSMRAGAYAAGLARRQGSQLIVLYVKPLTATPVVAPQAAQAINESHERIAADLLAQLDEHAPRLGIDIEFVVADGNPYAELLKLAEQRKVDAIVVGASTHAGHRLIGSLATKLVRSAAWPITVVP